ncbi:MAG: hypothetical protein ACETWQ_16390 [Phycisphaerae bacterium]
MKIFNALLIAVMLLGVCVPSFGDGKAFSGLDFSSLRPVMEREQRAVILHRDGVEKMLIAVSLELEEEDNALWIFPVPGAPERVKLDVVDSFPQFRGRDPRQKAKDIIMDVGIIALVTQIYTMPLIMTPHLGRDSGVADFKSVSIHGEIEKWGIHTEAVTAESIESLESYLQAKNVGIGRSELEAFKDYLSKEYVLVIVWISSREQLLEKFPEYGTGKRISQERWPCIYVEFDTERAFYPLRPTSTYGAELIPIHLRVIGYVAPEANSAFAERFHVRHYRQETLPKGTPSQLVSDMSANDLCYTSVEFRNLAETLTEDLWLTQVEPKGMKYAEAFVSVMGNRYIYFIFIICFILAVSYISAGLAGLLLFRKWSGYARLGLWNVLTLYGLYIATRDVKGAIGNRLRNPEKKIGIKTFIIVFSIFYVVITIILGNVLFGLL